jgi:hypothetical protein
MARPPISVNGPKTRAATILALVILATACSKPSGPAARACDRVAAISGGVYTVAGSFATTVGRVRDVIPTSRGIIPREWQDASVAVICYLDGEWAKGPPPVNGVIQPSFDRGVSVVIGGHFFGPLLLGYRNRIEIRDPNLTPTAS